MRDALSTLLLRIGLGGVFFWFGLDKYHDPHAWHTWVPVVIQGKLPVAMDLFLRIQGVTEMVFGALIVTGLFTRFACLICAAFILTVLHYFGLNQALIRDLALFMICLSLLVSGPKQISFDHLFFSRRRR